MAVTAPTAAVGGKVTATNINTLSSMLSLGISYSPTINNWTSSSTAPTTTGRYWVSGNFCQVLVNSTLGTGTITVGNISVTLPVAMDTTGMVLDGSLLDGAVGMFDVSVPQEYVGNVRVVDANTVRIMRQNATTIGGINPTTSTLPYTWATGDQISLAFSYPIA